MKLDQQDVKKICKRVVDYNLDTQFVADQYGVSHRQAQQLAKKYRETDSIPEIKTPGRKKNPALILMILRKKPAKIRQTRIYLLSFSITEYMPGDEEFECWGCHKMYPEDEKQPMGLCMECYLNHTNR